MALLVNIERWRAMLSKGFLRDIDDERTHPHKRALIRLLAAYFGPTSEEEKNLIEYTIRYNFGHSQRDRQLKPKDSETVGNGGDIDNQDPLGAMSDDILDIAKQAEKKFPKFFGGEANGDTGSSSGSRRDT